MADPQQASPSRVPTNDMQFMPQNRGGPQFPQNASPNTMRGNNGGTTVVVYPQQPTQGNSFKPPMQMIPNNNPSGSYHNMQMLPQNSMNTQPSKMMPQQQQRPSGMVTQPRPPPKPQPLHTCKQALDFAHHTGKNAAAVLNDGCQQSKVGSKTKQGKLNTSQKEILKVIQTLAEKLPKV